MELRSRTNRQLASSSTQPKKPFPLMQVQNSLLIVVFNKFQAPAYSRIHRSCRSVQNFVNEHHWRIGVKVDGNIRFWISYPKGSSKIVNVDVIIDNADKSYKTIPLYKALATFSGFTFSSVDLTFLGMYDKTFTTIQRDLLLQFFENRIWRNCKVISGKEEHMLMKYVTIIKPLAVSLNVLPKKNLPSYVKHLSVSNIDVDKMYDAVGRLSLLEQLHVNVKFKHDEIHMFFEHIVRLWKNKKLGNFVLLQTNLELQFEAFDTRSARMELWTRETFKELWSILKHTFFLYPDIQARSSGIPKKKDYFGTINVLMSMDGSRKQAALMIHFAASKEECRQCCTDVMSFCTDMDSIEFDDNLLPTVLPDE